LSDLAEAVSPSTPVLQEKAPGGAHGCCQGGVAGVSFGAVNGALIEGNAPEERLEALRAFWGAVSSPPLEPFGAPG
jgi:hypothetical protein